MKIIDTTKYEVDIVLERKKKEVEKNRSETNTWVQQKIDRDQE